MMKGDRSEVKGGGARTWRPNRHFFFLISFPDTNLNINKNKSVKLPPHSLTGYKRDPSFMNFMLTNTS